MIEIEGPGGVIVEFPDGTPSDVITKAMGSKFSPPASAASDGGKMDAFVRGMAKGGTMNWQEEMAGLGAASPLPGAAAGRQTTLGNIGAFDVLAGGAKLLAQKIAPSVFGDDGEKTRADDTAMRRAENTQAEKNYPLTSLAGNVAGLATPTGMVQAAMFGGAAGAPQSLLGRMASGAGTGAAMGAVSGAGDQNAVAGTIGGGIIGGALPVIGAGLGAGGRKLMDSLTVNRNLRGIGIDRDVADLVMPALNADKQLLGGARNIAAGGPYGMLADAGPATARILDTAVQGSAAGGNMALKASQQRLGALEGEFKGLADQTLGRTITPEAVGKYLRQSTTAGRGAAYEKAYSTPIDYTGEAGRAIESLMARVPGGAISKANQLMKMEGQASKQILADIADDGTVAFRAMPDVRQLDYITRAIRDIAKTNDGNGMLGGQTDVGRAAAGLAKEIRDKVKTLVPEYGEALKAAADPISRKEAFQFGLELLKPTVPRADAIAEIKSLSPVQLNYAQRAVRFAIDEMMANTKRMASDPDIDTRQLKAAWSSLNSDAAREKISALLGKEANTFLGKLDQVETALNLKARTATNSATFARNEMDRRITERLDGGVISRAMSGKPVKGVQELLGAAAGTTARAKASAKEGLYERIANLLTEAKGPQALTQFNALDQAYNKAARNSAIDPAIRDVVNLGFYLPGYQLSQQFRRE